jgi:hypothetical protein
LTGDGLTAVEERLGAASTSTKAFLAKGSRLFWITAVVLALCTLPVGIGSIGASIDFSWIAGLYMAADEGRHFGTEIVYTYGPLGFLVWPSLWIGSLAVISFVYTLVLYGAFVAMLTWSVKRTVGLAAAAVIVYLTSVAFGFFDQLPLMLAIGVCFIALREDRPPQAMNILVFGGGVLCAIEPLVKLSTGPPLVLMVLLAMFGSRAGRRQWACFLVTAIVGFFALWFISGQGLGNLTDYAETGVQIIKGYSEAMGYRTGDTWEAIAIVIFAIALILGIHRANFRDARAKWFATAITAVVAYTSYKYGTTQFAKSGPPVVALASLLAIFLMAPWPRSRAPLFVVATTIVGIVTVHASTLPVTLDPIVRVETFKKSAELAIRPGLRHQKIAEERNTLRTTLGVPEGVLAAMAGKTVNVEPWETTVVWAYELDWKPLPVFQNYPDYTEKLDHLDAAVAEDADGPEVLLRQIPEGSAGRPIFFERQPVWDPPEQGFVEFCNFVPTLTEGEWQVLSRIPDRCGEPKLAETVTVDEGETVHIPKAGKNEAVIMRIHGMKIGGIEKFTSLFVRPSERHAVMNEGEAIYRMPPDTTEDPMIVSADRKLGHGAELPELPDTLREMKLYGASGPYTVSFYRVPLKRTPAP